MINVPSYNSQSRFSVLGAIAACALCVVVGVTGWFYQMAISAITTPEMPAIVAMGYGAVIGVLVGKVVCRFGCNGGRNVMLFTIAASALALIAGYAQAYMGARAQVAEVEFETTGERDYVLEGFTFGAYLQWRVENGWIETSVSTSGYDKGKVTTREYKGVMVYLIWAGEALCVIGIAAFAGRYIGKQTRCLHCQKQMWSRQLGAVQPVDPRAMQAAENAGDLQTILYPQQISAVGDTRMVYVLHTCPGCGRSKYLSADLRWTEFRRGTTKLMHMTLLDRMIVDEANLAQLTSRLAIFAEVEAARRTLTVPAAYAQPRPPVVPMPLQQPTRPAPILPKPREKAPWE